MKTDKLHLWNLILSWYNKILVVLFSNTYIHKIHILLYLNVWNTPYRWNSPSYTCALKQNILLYNTLLSLIGSYKNYYFNAEWVLCCLVCVLVLKYCHWTYIFLRKLCYFIYNTRNSLFYFYVCISFIWICISSSQFKLRSSKQGQKSCVFFSWL